MVIWTPTERPVVLPLGFFDRQIVDAGNAQSHQAVRVEFPILVAIAAEPGIAVVTPFVGKTHGDAIVAWKCTYDGNAKFVPATCR